MAPIFEVRAHDNPKAMPLGTETLSIHKSPDAAWAHVEREAIRFVRSPYSIGGGYLRRIVVKIDDDGRESYVPPVHDNDGIDY